MVVTKAACVSQGGAGCPLLHVGAPGALFSARLSHRPRYLSIPHVLPCSPERWSIVTKVSRIARDKARTETRDILIAQAILARKQREATEWDPDHAKNPAPKPKSSQKPKAALIPKCVAASPRPPPSAPQLTDHVRRALTQICLIHAYFEFCIFGPKLAIRETVLRCAPPARPRPPSIQFAVAAVPQLGRVVRARVPAATAAATARLSGTVACTVARAGGQSVSV